MRRIVLAIALLLPTLAFATINASGLWFVPAEFDLGGPIWYFAQSGAALTVDNPAHPEILFTGTIDSATGAFTLSGEAASCPIELDTISGTVAEDNASFSATGIMHVGHCGPPPVGCGCVAFDFEFVGTRCGNRQLDPGEECDDGNTLDGDCCSSRCQNEVAGSACPDDGNLCTADVCSGVGTCTHPPLASATGCMEPVARRTPGSSFTLKASRPPTRLAWNWRHGAPTTASDFGDPTSATGYTLCLYDYSPAGAFLGMAMPIPAGRMCGQRPCWRATGRGFKYVNTAATPAGGTQRLVLALIDGTPRISLTGLGPDLTLPTLPLQKEPKVVVQLRNTAGVCWEADYSTAIKNTVTEFKAKSD
jgi:cysteine-rich repeat protein